MHFRSPIAAVSFAALMVVAAVGLAAPAVAAPAAPLAAAASAPVPAVSPPSTSYNGLALTPPMGWNDWSFYQCNIDENLILSQGRALVSTGLAAKGYDTVTTDDCWLAPQRDAAGNLVADPTKFPDGMAYVGQQLHAMGLKFGIYEDAGTNTCGGYPGSWGHITQDANTFAAWKVDYLKLDGCNVPNVAGQSSVETYKQVYTAMSDALVATGRPIVFSDSAPAYFQGTSSWDEVIDTSSHIANLWREGADTALGQESGAQKWGAIAYNYSYNVGLGQHAGPGHWNDPDFLLTGDAGLSTTEMQSQMSLWAEMAAPLISSTDLTKLSPEALSILGNKAIIAIDQDPLGKQGSIVQSGSNFDVLAKPLANGDVSVVLFNKADSAQTISTTAGTVGLSNGSPFGLTDLVTGAQTASNGIIAADVAPHGTVIYRVHPNASKHIAPAAHLTVSSGTFNADSPSTVTVTLTNDGPVSLFQPTATLTVPTGWSMQPGQKSLPNKIDAGRSASVDFQVTSTTPAPGKTISTLTANISYRSQDSTVHLSGELTDVSNVPFPNLAAAFNNVGITSESNPTPGNFDGTGNSFSAEKLAAQGATPGATITAGGATFTWPNVAAGTPDNVVVSGDVVTVAGQGTKLAFLGSEAGDVTSPVTVTYADGTSTTAPVGFPNWSFSSATEFGAQVALSTQGRNTPQGYADAAYAYRVFYNSIPIDPSKTVASVTLPTNGDIHIFALTVQPAA